MKLALLNQSNMQRKHINHLNKYLIYGKHQYLIRQMRLNTFLFIEKTSYHLLLFLLFDFQLEYIATHVLIFVSHCQNSQ